MRRAVRLGVLVGALAWMGPGVTYAQDATSERDAQSRFEEGLARVRAGNFEGARVSFLQAYAVLQKPSILWNLALAEEKTGNVLSALGHFKQFARVGPAGDDRSVAEKHIGELISQTGHLDVAAPTGAQLVLDGAAVGVAPLGDTLDVLPGRHRLEVLTAQGTREALADVASGQFIRVNLMPLEAAVLSPTSIRLGPTGGGEAAAPAAPQPSDHGASEARGPENDGASKGRLIAVVATGATAAVLVGVGVYFAVQSQSEANTANGYLNRVGPSGCFQSSVDPCQALFDARDAQSRDSTISNVFYVAGGVLAAGAVATWFLWPNTPARTSAARTLTFGASGTVLRLMGSF